MAPTQATPGPPREMRLIAIARHARNMSLDEAAKALSQRFMARFSGSRWSQLEGGYKVQAGEPVPQTAPHGRLAQMAYVVGVSPDQLTDAGRQDAAEVLQEILRQEHGAKPQREPSPGEALLERARGNPAVMAALDKLSPALRKQALEQAAELERRAREAERQAQEDLQRFVKALAVAESESERNRKIG